VHWEVKPIKYVSTCNNEVLPESTEPDYEIEYVDISSVDEVHGITSTQKMIFSNAPSRARRVVRDGDIIVSTVRTYLRAITSINNPSDNLIVSTGFAVIRSSIMLNVHFAHYLFKASYLVDEVIARSVGISYPAINSSELIAIKIGFPSLDEQSAIATFLDRETTKIDTLIAKQEHLIELLQEKRTALISHAVTKGLNPDASMKDSGVEWLGEVPAHWEVRRLKHNFRLLTQKTDRRENPVALENIQSWLGRFIPTETEFEGEGITFERGDILFGKLRPYLAKAFLAETAGEAVGDFFVMRPTSDINGRFALYQILNKEFISIVDGSTFGAKMPRVSWEFMSGMVLAMPTQDEQSAIAAFLDRKTTKIDTLIQKTRHAIDLLKERRTALISAAVTGKIDVRDGV